MGELTGIAGPFERHYGALERIEAPDTADGRDICESGNHLFIGVRERMIEAVGGLLNPGTGTAGLERRRFVAFQPLAHHPALAGHDVLVVDDNESFPATCLRVTGRRPVAVLCITPAPPCAPVPHPIY